MPERRPEAGESQFPDRFRRCQSIIVLCPTQIVPALNEPRLRRVVAGLVVVVAVLSAAKFIGGHRIWVPAILLALSLVLVVPLGDRGAGGWREQGTEFRVRGIFFSQWTFWWVGTLWGASSLTIRAESIALRGPLNSVTLRREDLLQITVGSYLWHGNCLIFRPQASAKDFYFALQRSDFERTCTALTQLGWLRSDAT